MILPALQGRGGRTNQGVAAPIAPTEPPSASSLPTIAPSNAALGDRGDDGALELIEVLDRLNCFGGGSSGLEHYELRIW